MVTRMTGMTREETGMTMVIRMTGIIRMTGLTSVTWVTGMTRTFLSHLLC